MSNELKHYGVLGMKWGVRKYQNKDGSLTSAGKKRYTGKDGTDYSEYKSHGQKKWEKKVTKAKTDAQRKKAEEVLERFKTRDNARKEYATKSSSGKSVARSLLIGPVFNGSYSRIMSGSNSKTHPAVAAGAALVDNMFLMGVGSYAYERSQARKRTKSDSK